MWFSRALLAAGIALAAPSGAADSPVEAPLVNDTGMELVQANCGACHSLALVTQNRMGRERWLATIRWMQDKQGLWDLGEAEGPIVEYLAEHYGVSEPRLRRKPLKPIIDEG